MLATMIDRSAANIYLHMRRNLLDDTPPRTRGFTTPLKQRNELQQVINAKPRSPGGDLCKRILTGQAGPRRQHRAQPAVRVEEHHPVLAPVLFARRQHELTSALGMERVRDREGYGRSMTLITRSC